MLLTDDKTVLCFDENAGTLPQCLACKFFLPDTDIEDVDYQRQKYKLLCNRN